MALFDLGFVVGLSYMYSLDNLLFDALISSIFYRRIYHRVRSRLILVIIDKILTELWPFYDVESSSLGLARSHFWLLKGSIDFIQSLQKGKTLYNTCQLVLIWRSFAKILTEVFPLFVCVIWFFTSQPTVFRYVGGFFFGWIRTKQGWMCLAQGHNPVTPVRHYFFVVVWLLVLFFSSSCILRSHSLAILLLFMSVHFTVTSDAHDLTWEYTFLTSEQQINIISIKVNNENQTMKNYPACTI